MKNRIDDFISEEVGFWGVNNHLKEELFIIGDGWDSADNDDPHVDDNGDGMWIGA